MKPISNIDNWSMEDFLQANKEMFNWLADEMERTKKCIKENEFIRRSGWCNLSLCCGSFLCQYNYKILGNKSHKVDGNRGSCEKCPADWGNSKRYMPCLHRTSPYEKYRKAIIANDWKSAVKYAREVANVSKKVPHWDDEEDLGEVLFKDLQPGDFFDTYFGSGTGGSTCMKIDEAKDLKGNHFNAVSVGDYGKTFYFDDDEEVFYLIDAEVIENG